MADAVQEKEPTSSAVYPAPTTSCSLLLPYKSKPLHVYMYSGAHLLKRSAWCCRSIGFSPHTFSKTFSPSLGFSCEFSLKFLGHKKFFWGKLTYVAGMAGVFLFGQKHTKKVSGFNMQLCCKRKRNNKKKALKH
jgi:hypothetical protein